MQLERMYITESKKTLTVPLVSVIVPSYNRVNTVTHTIDSILNQQCNFKFEIIIGDDASTDGVREVLQKYQSAYPDSITLILHHQNVGLGANWAICVKHCKGKYIANCDNDDYWHNPQKLQLQVDFMENNPIYGFCHTNYRIHNRESGHIKEVIASRIIHQNEQLQKAIFKGQFKCCNATVLYRKDVLNQYLNLEDYINFKFTLQDWNTWIILAKYTDFYCLPISTATFGVETESITRPKSFEILERRLTREKQCYKYICNLFPETFPYREQEYDEYIAVTLLQLAYQNKDFKNAKKYGQLVHGNSLKKLVTHSFPLFMAYIWLRKLKYRFV